MSKKPWSTGGSLILGTLVGVAFFFGGYLLCIGDHDEYGAVMFMLIPSASGFAIAAVVHRASILSACCILTFTITLLILIFFGWEGYLCCLMALPLLALGMALGALAGYFLRGRFLDHTQHPGRNLSLVLVACPLLVVTANNLEEPHRHSQRLETFTTQIYVSATSDDTWQCLARVPTLQGPKPFLLRIGLPIPYQCTLERDAVGGKRICNFDQGVITQEVTEWQKPDSMSLKITKCTLPGRQWLTFVDASYELKRVATGTVVVRHSTIASRLYPRWYWRPFEAWGVESEHQYVLSNIKAAAESKELPATRTE